MNVPHASHMGGAWERLIGTTRRALETSIIKAGTQLNDEAFRTFMTEAECIINSRPLTIENLGNPDAPEPLTLMLPRKTNHCLHRTQYPPKKIRNQTHNSGWYTQRATYTSVKPRRNNTKHTLFSIRMRRSGNMNR